MNDTKTKVAPLIPRLTEKNYAEWNRNIRAVLRKQKLWKYTQTAWGPDEGEVEKKSDWEEKSMEAADLMTPTITAPIQAELIEDEFNDGYKTYKRLKVLLQPLCETQFMHLTRQYYTLNYRNYKGVSDFLDQVETLEEQIDATGVTMTADKRTLLCLTMALWNEPHYYRPLMKVWGETKNMTAEKARQMLLEEEQKDSKQTQEQQIGIDDDNTRPPPRSPRCSSNGRLSTLRENRTQGRLLLEKASGADPPPQKSI